MGTQDAGGLSAVVSTSGQLTNLHFRIRQESAADLYAKIAIIRRYQHGGNSLDLFERIKVKDSRGKFEEYLSTHPFTQDRIDELNKIAAQRGWSMEGEITDMPENISNW